MFHHDYGMKRLLSCWFCKWGNWGPLAQWECWDHTIPPGVSPVHFSCPLCSQTSVLRDDQAGWRTRTGLRSEKLSDHQLSQLVTDSRVCLLHKIFYSGEQLVAQGMKGPPMRAIQEWRPGEGSKELLTEHSSQPVNRSDISDLLHWTEGFSTWKRPQGI